MNKHISFVLALLFLVSNIGLVFNVHYCDNKLASISFDYKTAEPCLENKKILEKSCCALENNHDDCCKNSKIDIKKSSVDTVIVKSIPLDLSAFVLTSVLQVPNFNSSFEKITKHKKVYFYCESNAPPFYKLYSQLLFYA